MLQFWEFDSGFNNYFTIEQRKEESGSKKGDYLVENEEF